MVPVIRAASLRGFVELVDGLGGDPDELLARFGLAREVLDRDEDLIPITANDLVLDAAAAELGCPGLGPSTSTTRWSRRRRWPTAASGAHVGSRSPLDRTRPVATLLAGRPDVRPRRDRVRRDQGGLMLEVNAVGATNGTVAAVGAMRAGGGGHVVNVVSLAGLTAVAGEAVYAASKHAAIGFSLSTMADLRAAGVEDIRISCVCPDGIWTPMLHDKLTGPDSALPFSGKLLRPEEVFTAVRAVLDRPRLVTAVPGRRGLLSRLADAAPSLGLAAVPLVVARGRRTRRRLLAKGGPTAPGAGGSRSRPR
ncbi:SDR family NAD(P)-dependent oxidoreductase [Streptomyces sp. NPDC057148]|uniref:SDR family NAD(P)-dependent oxidoreductase n=1 Tax=unclassified Streptomyces TaxID=2593676 RepID=UPI00363D4189